MTIQHNDFQEQSFTQKQKKTKQLFKIPSITKPVSEYAQSEI